MALAHKGLDHVATPVGFTEIPAMLDGTQKRVPVIVVADSWAIAEYLDETYPDRPSLFHGPAGMGLARFVDNCVGTLMGEIVRIVLVAIHDAARPEDRDYFRADREKSFGKTLEAVVEGREARIESLRKLLGPTRRTLRNQAFLGGEEPHYADYLLFGAFQWPRVISDVPLLAEDDPVALWFERCLDLHGGLARKAAAIGARWARGRS